MGPDARWRRSKGRAPFKEKLSPILKVPGLSDASRALIDPAHTWHMGLLYCIYSNVPGLQPNSCWFLQLIRCGKDFVTSGLVLLCKLELVPGRGLPTRLCAAYSDFASWCSRRGKSTSIRGFTKSGFKMGCLSSINYKLYYI